jgi:L-aminopeptidase/D-esterase-like protein
VITDVPGLRVGHWTDPVAATGCTVVLFPAGTVASGEVRGGAPATREFALLEPGRMVDGIDALVLTGGSAFGLAAADGVMRFCEERGMGFATPAGPVPIVVALALFDLMTGDPRVRPGPEQGYAACEAAGDGEVAVGTVGAGTGATVAAVPESPPPTAMPPAEGGDALPPRAPGGVVTAAVRVGDLVVAALVVVNAAGLPGGDTGLAVPLALARAAADTAGGTARSFGAGLANTTIGLVATNARLDKMGCHLVAQGAHDGLARAVFPAHTRADGDAFVAAATGEVPADPDVVRVLGTHVVAEAIGNLPGPGHRDGGR